MNDQGCEGRFSETTFAYLAGWSGGDPDAVQATAERVLDCAQQITQRLGAAAELVAAAEPGA